MLALVVAGPIPFGCTPVRAEVRIGCRTFGFTFVTAPPAQRLLPPKGRAPFAALSDDPTLGGWLYFLPRDDAKALTLYALDGIALAPLEGGVKVTVFWGSELKGKLALC